MARDIADESDTSGKETEVEVYRGTTRPKLPIRVGEPVNRVDRKTNHRAFESIEDARREGLRREHMRFPGQHDKGYGHQTPTHSEPQGVECPLCEG